MATDHTKSFGQHGEKLAADYLVRQGYTISGVNWRCQHGEIDIIAHQNDTLVFVEVRTRHSSTPETAFESINTRKREKLTALAQYYLSLGKSEITNWRVDVIAIAVPPEGSPIIHHIEDALDW